MSCFDDQEVEDLTSCLNQETASGVSEVGIYYALHAQATTVPMPLKRTDPGYTYEKGVTVTEDIVWQAGKGFSKIDVLVDTGEIKHETPGNKGNKKIKQLFDFFVPNTAKKTLGLVKTHLNTPMIFMVTDKDGSKRQLGDAHNPAYISENTGTSGKTGEDERGVQFTIETYGTIIYYEGEVQMHTAPVVVP